jgi:hypothetical protein
MHAPLLFNPRIESPLQAQIPTRGTHGLAAGRRWVCPHLCGSIKTLRLACACGVASGPVRWFNKSQQVVDLRLRGRRWVGARYSGRQSLLELNQKGGFRHHPSKWWLSLPPQHDRA